MGKGGAPSPRSIGASGRNRPAVAARGRIRYTALPQVCDAGCKRPLRASKICMYTNTPDNLPHRSCAAARTGLRYQFVLWPWVQVRISDRRGGRADGCRRANTPGPKPIQAEPVRPSRDGLATLNGAARMMKVVHRVAPRRGNARGRAPGGVAPDA